MHTRLSGASDARHSLRPLIGEGGTSRPNLVRIARRDREIVSRVIACDKREAFAQGSGATKQSIVQQERRLDCFAAPVIGARIRAIRWLAMTEERGAGATPLRFYCPANTRCRGVPVSMRRRARLSNGKRIPRQMTAAARRACAGFVECCPRPLVGAMHCFQMGERQACAVRTADIALALFGTRAVTLEK